MNILLRAGSVEVGPKASLLTGSVEIDTEVCLPASILGDWKIDAATDDEIAGWSATYRGQDERPGAVDPEPWPPGTAVVGYNTIPQGGAQRPLGLVDSHSENAIDAEPGVSRWVVLRGSDVAQGNAVRQAMRLLRHDLGIAGRVQPIRRPEIWQRYRELVESAGSAVAREWLMDTDLLGNGHRDTHVWLPSAPWYPRYTTTTIDAKWIEDLRATAWRIQDLDSVSYPNLATALELYVDTDRLHPDKALFTVGRFASLESLLTHKPRVGDEQDSISNQLARSIGVLSAKMDVPIDFASFTNESELSRVVKRAYGFRSLIAHGMQRLQFSEPFPTSTRELRQLGIFGTPFNAAVLCHEMTRRSLHEALRDPLTARSLKG